MRGEGTTLTLKTDMRRLSIGAIKVVTTVDYTFVVEHCLVCSQVWPGAHVYIQPRKTLVVNTYPERTRFIRKRTGSTSWHCIGLISQHEARYAYRELQWQDLCLITAERLVLDPPDPRMVGTLLLSKQRKNLVYCKHTVILSCCM